MKKGEIHGVVIDSQSKRPLRSDRSTVLQQQIETGIKLVAAYAKKLEEALKQRLDRPEKQLILLIKDVFLFLDDTALAKLISRANKDRYYGQPATLQEQYSDLKLVYDQITVAKPKTPEADKWLQIYSSPELYKGKEDILRLALASFVKSPLEATAESIGSVINKHGSLARCSLKMDSLSDEVFIAWNGAPFPSERTTKLLHKAVDEYFQNHKSGPRFYIRTKLKLVSTTVGAYLRRPARIEY